MASNYTVADNNAIAKEAASNRWVTVDISALMLRQLYQDYRKVEVKLLDFYGKIKTLKLRSIETEVFNSELTISEWLETLDSRTLPVIDGWRGLTFTKVPYYPLNSKVLTMDVAASNKYPTGNIALDDAADMVVTLPDTLPKEASDYGLFSVNGYYYRTNYHDYGLRIIDCVKTIKNVGMCYFGMLNFKGVGKVETTPITENMIAAVDSSMDMRHKQLISYSKADFTKCTVGIVICGKLFLLDDYIKVISATALTISLHDTAITDLLQATYADIDTADYVLDGFSEGVGADFVTDDLIRALLTSKNSFIVTIANTEISQDINAVSNSTVISKYIVPTSTHLGRMVTSDGFGVDYIPVEEEGQYVLSTDKLIKGKFSANTYRWKTAGGVIDDTQELFNNTSRYQVNLITYFARA